MALMAKRCSLATADSQLQTCYRLGSMHTPVSGLPWLAIARVPAVLLTREVNSSEMLPNLKNKMLPNLNKEMLPNLKKEMLPNLSVETNIPKRCGCPPTQR